MLQVRLLRVTDGRRSVWIVSIPDASSASKALSAQDGKKIAAIAELDVLGVDGKPISREKWRIRYADSEETRSGNCTGDKVFDLQESTYWMTVARDAYPHQLVIDLGGDYTVTGFRYLPRAEKDTLV